LNGSLDKQAGLRKEDPGSDRRFRKDGRLGRIGGIGAMEDLAGSNWSAGKTGTPEGKIKPVIPYLSEERLKRKGDPQPGGEFLKRIVYLGETLGKGNLRKTRFSGWRHVYRHTALGGRTNLRHCRGKDIPEERETACPTSTCKS